MLWHRIRVALMIAVAAPSLAAPSLAAAADVEIESLSVNGPDMVVGTPTNQIVDVLVRNTAPGLAGETVVTIEFPFPLDAWDVDVRPLMLAGELSWDSNDGTELYLGDYGPTDFLDEIALTADGLPGDEGICGIYGLDMHPDTAEIWVIVGTFHPDYDGGECEGAYDLYEWHNRYLGVLDPFTGVVSIVGQMTWHSRNLAFLPDGTLLTIEGWRDTGHNDGDHYLEGAVGARIHQVDLASGAMTVWHVPSSTVDDSSGDTAGVLAWNPVDGRLWFFDQSECFMIGIDPATKAEVVQDTDYCSGIDTGMRWFRDGEFFFQEESSLYRQSYDLGGEIWENSFMGSFPMTMRDWVFGGNWHNGVDCVATGAILTCTMSDVVPWGGWMLEVDAEFTPTGAGDAVFNADTARSGDPEDLGTASETRTVLAAADLAVGVSPSGERYFPGDALVYTVEIANDGGVDTADVTLVLTFPDNVTPVSLGAAGGFGCGALQPDRTITCTRGGLVAGDSTTLTYNATAGAEGVATLTAEVSTSTNEPNLTNNTAGSRLVFGAATNLQLSMTSVDTAIERGAETTIVVTVVNAGPDAAIDIAMAVPVPDGLTLDGASCTVADGVLTCDLGDLAVDASVEIEIGVTAGELGGYFAVAPKAEAANPPELTPGDNAAGTSVGVLGPSLTVAAGPASPAGGSLDFGSAAGLQLALTHGGGIQDLVIRHLTVESNATIGGKAANVSLRVVHDLNADGKADADEPTLTTGVAVVAGSTAQVALGGLIVPADATVHVLLIPTSVAVSNAPVEDEGADAEGETAALALPFLAAGLLAFRRRRGLWVVAATLMIAVPGCEVLNGFLPPPSRFTAQFTVTAVEAGIDGVSAPATVVEGLPVAGAELLFLR